MPAEEKELRIFDIYWFEYCILCQKQPSISNSIMDEKVEEVEPKLKLSSTPSFIVRSFSDQHLSSKDSSNLASSDHSPSPKSVLHFRKLHTILSGKEVVGEVSEVGKNKEGFDDGKKRRKGRRRSNSKSLSELEFEELKGFMDLGFVFSVEDKDTSLVSIIPGLQRLGRKVDEEEEEEKKDFVDEKSVVSRPYLSEAWDVLDEKKAERKMKKQLMNWRINPALGNEMEIKDQLRFWAHTVASTVR